MVACQNERPPLWPDAAVLTPARIDTSDAVAIRPGGSHRLAFSLLGPQGEPVAGSIIRFSILDSKETPGSGGARLSQSSGLTDENGSVTLQIIAGTGSDAAKPLSFSVQASAGNLSKVLPVFVTSGDLASAEIVLVPEEQPGEAITSTSVYFYDDTVCADVPWDRPPPSIRPMRTLATGVLSAVFSNVVTSGFHAVLAVGTAERGRVVAKGCTDLPGHSLSSTQIIRVLLPLARMHVSPVGTYRVDAQFPLPPDQPGFASIRDRWRSFSARPCDPASLWLDCTIDALSGDSEDDPLDCRPVSYGEGELGDLLSAKRAMPGGKTCTSQLDASGMPSLDTKTNALFPAVYLSSLSLAKMPDEVGTTLGRLSVESTLTVAESDSEDVFNIRHALDKLTLSYTNGSMPLSAQSLGLPVRDLWFASRQTRPGQLELSAHGFTLRLGSLARLVYFKTSLASRLGLAEAGAFVSSLYDGATRSPRNTMLRGCDALDSLLCEEVGLDRGCIKPACQAGLERLGQTLDASFAVLDGPGLDFFLSGSAPLVDLDGNKQADTLANSFMTANFTTPSPSIVIGSWSAERVPSSITP